MASKVYSVDADFDITSYPNLLTKSDNVTLTLNQCLDLDGDSDWMTANGLVATCANYTTGAIGGWFYCDADDAGTHYLGGFFRNASNHSTRLFMFYYLGATAPAGHIEVELDVDGTKKWQWRSAANVTDALIGAWAHFMVDQDGTDPHFYLNGVDITADGTFVVSTDTTAWLKAIITDATNDSDYFALGIYRQNGASAAYWDGKMDKVQVYSSNLGAATIATLAAAGRIDGADTPANCVANFNFRGDMTDSSSSGNDGTGVGTAAVINDPAATGIYSTTSPEAYLIEAGNEYAIDAGAGNYVLVSAASDTEVTPAGTSIKYKYCLTDSATRAGASWSAGWQAIADLETSLKADTSKKRYLHLKVQENSDGTATPTLSDMTVTYTTPAATVAGGGHKIMRGVGTGVMTGVC